MLPPREAVAIALPGELRALFDLDRGSLFWAIIAGISLTVAVSSLFHALSLGPANVVVPIEGVFIVGGALGIVVLASR